jgi:antitoxin component of MazEF toxin-antitoxin module
MTKKLIQHGNSSALIIDKPILELLSITPDTHLDLKTDGKSLIITPIDTIIEDSLKKINEKHSKTLKRLAQ